MLTRRDKDFVCRRVDARSLDLKGMKVAIVGGTDGIGRALSRFLVSRAVAVLAIGQTFRDPDVPGVEFIKGDLSLMREARRVGSLFIAHCCLQKLDLVIFTIEIFAAPKRQETAPTPTLNASRLSWFLRISKATAERCSIQGALQSSRSQN